MHWQIVARPFYEPITFLQVIGSIESSPDNAILADMEKTKTNNSVARLLARLTLARKKLPDSFLKAASIIRDSKQRRDLERHVKKMRSEWR